MPSSQPQFSGSIPENYDRYMAPVLFEPYAASMAPRVAELKPVTVLELACGTGALTRALAASLGPETRVVATDFSPEMLDYALRNLDASAPIEWKVADACALPFEDERFDVVVCQFGAMFFPDKPAAMAEAFRVLSPGGSFLFSTWDHVSKNPLFQIVEETLAVMFPSEETPFMPTAFSMSDPQIHRDLVRNAGFQVQEVFEESHTVGPHDPGSLAAGFAYGTPLSAYLRDQGYDLEAIRSALTAAFAEILGDPMIGEMQAICCQATKF